MSARTIVNRPVVAFSDPGLGLWGVCVGGPAARLALGPLPAAGNGDALGPLPAAGDGGALRRPSGIGDGNSVPAEIPWRAAELVLGEPGGDWGIRADGVALRVGPAARASGGEGPGAPAPGGPGQTAGEGPERAAGDGPVWCEVSGTHTIDGETLAIATTGARCAPPPRGKLDSLRLVAAWFAVAHGVTLLATRPAGAGGQDKDAVDVAVYGEANGIGVFDPRLSTTYDGRMRPRRMGVELWLGETEDGDQHPRRVAGQRAGPYADAVLEGVRTGAWLMRCQGSGDEGTGVYVLISRA